MIIYKINNELNFFRIYIYYILLNIFEKILSKKNELYNNNFLIFFYFQLLIRFKFYNSYQIFLYIN